MPQVANPTLAAVEIMLLIVEVDPTGVMDRIGTFSVPPSLTVYESGVSLKSTDVCPGAGGGVDGDASRIDAALETEISDIPRSESMLP
jgi:hypothetical protein